MADTETTHSHQLFSSYLLAAGPAHIIVAVSKQLIYMDIIAVKLVCIIKT